MGWVGETWHLAHFIGMSRTPHIPVALRARPFSLGEALKAGLTKSSLKGRTWRHLGAGLYCWNSLDEDPWQVLRAWQDSLPKEALFAGATAAWISGLDFKAIDPVEIVVPRHSGVRSRPGLAVRHCQVPASDAITIRGLRTTTLNRALGDLSLRLPAVEVLGRDRHGNASRLDAELHWAKVAVHCRACGAGRIADGDPASMASDPAGVATP
jgi:hypothetical protein